VENKIWCLESFNRDEGDERDKIPILDALAKKSFWPLISQITQINSFGF
jgi:hypothetical protein